MNFSPFNFDFSKLADVLHYEMSHQNHICGINSEQR